MVKFIITLLILFPASLLCQEDAKKKVVSEFDMEINSDYTLYFKSGLYTGQNQNFFSVALIPDFSMEWADGKHQLVGTFFYRLNIGDSERSHGDIRELYYHTYIKKWEFSLGLKKVFWGTTESNHLVDIINQSDLVEQIDGEAKLGQPMMQLTWLTKLGNFDFFLLPFHRKRTIAGQGGRFRFPILIDDSLARYEADWNEFGLGGGFRYSTYFGVFDVGLSYVHTTNREFLIQFSNSGLITSLYEKIHQIGIDLQATTGSMLWKAESIYRFADSDNFLATTLGVEYTFANINNKGLDLGVILEYLYDNREPLIIDFSAGAISGSTGTNFQNDLFMGGRLAFNDTQDASLLVGSIIDLGTGSTIFSANFQRRFFQNIRAEIDLFVLNNVKPKELFYSFRNDSFMKFSMSYFL